MILGFKQRFPNGTPTFFEEMIKAGVGIVKEGWNFTPKIHSIREGDRWEAGKSIQMAYGVRTKNYKQFNKGIEALSTCKSVQEIYITYFKGFLEVSIDDKYIYNKQLNALICNDGLTELEFKKWFFPKGKFTFTGQIIHWTDFKY